MTRNKKIVKFSKEYSDIKNIKKSFFEENLTHLEKRKEIYSHYVKQPKRAVCKNCEAKIADEFITIHGVDYSFCESCGHINGLNEDTKEFTENLYFNEKGNNYSKVYLNDFVKRVEKIYTPKLEFLQQVVGKFTKILDIGCGAGHFVYACELAGVEARGIEPSEELVSLGKNFIKKNELKNVKMDDAYEAIKETDCSVISLIGVLEHVRYPRKILDSFLKSSAEHLFILVPIFSLSNFLEANFLSVFPRHSSGGHTHFYTEESLNFLSRDYGLRISGEWWFGQDFADLYRSLLLNSNNNSSTYERFLKKYLYDDLYALQNILDKKKICSEVHMVLSK